MAAGGGAVRLRLVFDHPPPASPGCSLCWLLLEPGQVRLVTDLLSLIRHRFGFSRRARLSLFLEGALLPPAESARLVRDNDSLRVKLEEIAADDYEEIDDGFTHAAKEDKKRHRHKQDEEEFSRNEGKHKRKREKEKHNLEYSSCREETSVAIRDSEKRPTKRRRKEEVSGRNRLAEGKEESSTAHSKKLKKTEREMQLSTKTKEEKQKKAAAKMALEQANESFSLNSGKSSAKKIATQSRKKRVGASDSSSTSSDSDSSELNIKENKSSHKPVVATLPKDKSQAASNSDVKTNEVTVKSNTEKTKTAIKRNAKKPQSSSSDSDSSSEDEVTAAQESTAKEKSLPKHTVAVKASTKAPQAKSSSSDSDSSDSDALVIKKSAADAALGSSMVRSCTKQLPARAQGQLASPGRGRGCGTGQETCRAPRGRGFRGMMRARGHGRGTNSGFFYNYGSEGQKQMPLNEAALNISLFVTNPEAIFKRDYSTLPLLAAPPQVGERIAFKHLELTENYSPEVSDYKEARITGWNAEKKEIELEILSTSAEEFAKEPGKFDLVYQSADGAELIEYAVPQDRKITESWDALIEPRLIVESPVNGSSFEN